jgi:N-acetylmuramoyl-L-alanine amidase
MFQNLKKIHTIYVHCSATIAGRWFDMADIRRMHQARTPPFSREGYHFAILLDGAREHGRPMTMTGAHVRGNNMNTLGICMIGGLDENRKPADTFTEPQYDGLFELLFWLKPQLPGLKRIVGHRQVSPDLNGDGQITREEYLKECPCWHVPDKLPGWGLAQYMLPAHLDISLLT